MTRRHSSTTCRPTSRITRSRSVANRTLPAAVAALGGNLCQRAVHSHTRRGVSHGCLRAIRRCSPLSGRADLDKSMPSGDQHCGDLLCRPQGWRFAVGDGCRVPLHPGAVLALSGLGGPAGNHRAVDPRGVGVPPEVYAPGSRAIFLLLGMFLVGLITTNLGGAGMSEGMQKRIDTMGVWGALPLGVLFAVSFCPTSAAWFFGLIALIMGSEAGAITTLLARIGISLPGASLPGGTLVLPFIYGVGTALPVLVVAFLLAYSAKSVGKTYNMLSKVEWWARQITGWIFILAGVYFSLKYAFEVI